MGFAIQSSLAFHTLRTGDGTPLAVEHWSGSAPDGEELLTWRARPGNPFHGRLVSTGPGYAFWASDTGWYLIDPAAPSIAIQDDRPSLMAEIRMFGVPASLCAVAAGDLALHASAVEIGGEAVLFGGPSMHGKTTLAAGLAARGHRLLAEDTIRCRTSPAAHVWPGPSVVRLRADVAPRIDVRHAVRGSMPNGRVSLVLDPAHRGDGSSVPLRTVILLRRGDAVTLRPVPRPAAARDLFALAFRLPLAEQRAATFERIVDLVARVEVLDLHRPLTLASMDEVMDAVEQGIGR